MTPHVSRARHLARRFAPVAAVVTLTALTASGAVTSTSAEASTAAAAGCAEPGSAARVSEGAAVAEPALYAAKDAKKYGVIKPHPMMTAGSVTVETVFHVVTDQPTTPAEKSRYAALITAQVQVLNDAYAGRTSPDAAASPFRFALERTTYTVNPAWASLARGEGNGR